MSSWWTYTCPRVPLGSEAGLNDEDAPSCELASQISAALLRQRPVAVGDADHRGRALVEPIVILGRHVEHAVGCDGRARVLGAVAQRGAEFRRAGLCLLERFGNRARKQQVRTPRMPAERG